MPKHWYLMINGEADGPLDSVELKDEIALFSYYEYAADDGEGVEVVSC